jgi:cytochrome c2
MALIRRDGKTAMVPVVDGQAQAPVKSSDGLAVVVRLKQARKLVTARFAQAALVIPALSPDAAAGKTAFDGGCAKCHGQALRGTDKAPPLLHPLYAPGSGHGDSLILAAMTHGATGHMWKFGDMPKPDGLEPGQDKQILAYIRVMQAANGLGDGAGLGSDVCVIEGR